MTSIWSNNTLLVANSNKKYSSILHHGAPDTDLADSRLFESPELNWSFNKLFRNEAPHFLRFYMKTWTRKNLDAEILKTSNLSNKIICRPPQFRETIPSSNSRSQKSSLTYECFSSHYAAITNCIFRRWKVMNTSLKIDYRVKKNF